MADRNALAKALMPPQLTSGPEPRWRNRLADAIHGYVPSLADRLNDPFSGAGMAVDALGTMVASPVDAMTKYFANPYQPGERTPENRNALMHGFEAAGLAQAGAMGAARATMPRNALGSAGGEAPKGIRAYHGSPHDFDRFEMSKIGTGEGAQAYGHGLYFAENEGVAKAYRDTLSDKTTNKGWLGMFETPYQMVQRYVREAGGIAATAKTRMQSELANASPSQRAGLESALADFDKHLQPQGRLYEVSIKAEPEDFLDWDKPLSQQSEKVKKKLGIPPPDKLIEAEALAREIDRLNRIIDGNGRRSDPHPNDAMRMKDDAVRRYLEIDPTESAWWKNDAKDEASRPEAAQKMRDAGIAGIRYLDQGSRSAGDGTRNYVVFDDSLVEIIRKYGLAGLMALGASNPLLDPRDGGQ